MSGIQDSEDPPRFCGQCGEPLVRWESHIPMGYDVQTGEKRPYRLHITLQCLTQMHDVWVLSDSGSLWVQP